MKKIHPLVVSSAASQQNKYHNVVAPGNFEEGRRVQIMIRNLSSLKFLWKCTLHTLMHTFAVVEVSLSCTSYTFSNFSESQYKPRPSWYSASCLCCQDDHRRLMVGENTTWLGDFTQYPVMVNNLRIALLVEFTPLPAHTLFWHACCSTMMLLVLHWFCRPKNS